MVMKSRSFRPAYLPKPEALTQARDRRRGSARRRGYDAAWDKAALAYKRQHPLCLGCEAVGLATATQAVDHVRPHRGDRVLFWDRDNWQPACAWHHDVVKRRLELRYERGQLGAEALRLDSTAAKALTRRLLPSR